MMTRKTKKQNPTNSVERLTKKQRAEIVRFIRDHGVTPRIDCENLLCEIECLQHNTRNSLKRMMQSTKQRRDRKAELENVLRAVKRLSLDTREILSMEIMGGIAQARGDRTWMCDGRDIDGLELAIRTTLSMVSTCKRDRGPGHMAHVRRAFVRDAGVMYLMAGFDRIGASDESVFMAWLNMIDALMSLNLTTDHGSLKRSIRESIGATKPERDAWKVKKMQTIERRYPA
jgi:hypothetical protein